MRLVSLWLLCLLPRVVSAQAQTPDTTKAPPPAASSSPQGSAQWAVWVLGTQVDAIAQHLAPFTSPYSGPNSLTASGDTKISHAYGVYLGAQAWDGVDAYLDVEMIRGKGVGRTVGLAGITNGDVIRQGSVDLGSGPYVARAFVRYVHGFGASTDTLARAMDQAPAIVATQRIEVTAGKFAVTDLFDVNRYANSPRLQFMNWALFQNSAWDYAADTRGYSNGVALAWIAPLWSFRLASFQMPTVANGNVFDSDLRRANGNEAELTVNVPITGTVVRTLGYFNQARMGSYDDAIARALATGTTPNIVADDSVGRTKYGFGLNVEQPIADDGETGAFLRAGWSDGRNESFVFTEVDREMSAGFQLSGAHWGRAADRLGIAGVDQWISHAHEEYLALGGLGFLLGDGRLNYGAEQIVEAYYRAQMGAYVEVSPDLQLIRDPGYNRDRGPATVLSLRFNFRY